MATQLEDSPVRSRLTILVLFLSFTGLPTFCKSADEPVSAVPEQNPNQVQSKVDKGVATTAVDVSANAERILAQLRGRIPKKTDDEIIQVLRG